MEQIQKFQKFQNHSLPWVRGGFRAVVLSFL
jgi:hypothetical protein